MDKLIRQKKLLLLLSIIPITLAACTYLLFYYYQRMPHTIPLSEVAKHNSEKSCWMAIHGKVYDVTKFIPDHPGQDVILVGCGKDATYYFENLPMGDMKMPHSDEARRLLNQFYIGELTK